MATGPLTINNNTTITGDLTVSGTTTTINTNNLTVKDKNIIIGNVDSPSNITGDGGGLTLKAASDKTFNWVSSTNRWTSNVGVEASALVRTGGTTAQFLKADGTTQELTTGKTIYVDSGAGVGTDTRTGFSKYDISKPFATIGAAMAESVIGDTVRVRAGNYTITSTINLNGRGNLHFEEGAQVTCSVSSGTVSGPVFSLAANQSKSISGGGQFIITGNTGTFWLQAGGGLQTQLCSVECATIRTTTAALNAAKIFDVSTGVLVVNAETVYALSSTIIECAGTSSNLHYAVKFTYCWRFAHFPNSGSSAQMSCDCWTIACYGPKCFEIVGGTVGAKYESLFDNAPTATGCTFFSLEYGNNSTANALVIRGGRAMTYSTNPCISFTTTTGTNKSVRLIGDPFFHTSGPNSITAASARSVLCSFASSNKAVDSSFVTIVGGTYAVNAGFTS
jgi:hypothetical protein